ncbi:hypothetical protein UPYG_G00277650 [Umbra pygmaea]|uniref:Uncharacterized protein n=1 Tax=Umbra pygmaea TaxID=75934 RepID=A0ABD0WND0_UMBPY
MGITLADDLALSSSMETVSEESETEVGEPEGLVGRVPQPQRKRNNEELSDPHQAEEKKVTGEGELVRGDPSCLPEPVRISASNKRHKRYSRSASSCTPGAQQDISAPVGGGTSSGSTVPPGTGWREQTPTCPYLLAGRAPNIAARAGWTGRGPTPPEKRTQFPGPSARAARCTAGLQNLLAGMRWRLPALWQWPWVATVMLRWTKQGPRGRRDPECGSPVPVEGGGPTHPGVPPPRCPCRQRIDTGRDLLCALRGLDFVHGPEGRDGGRPMLTCPVAASNRTASVCTCF